MSAVMAGRERPILFSGAMVRAILDGRKTQTRRVVEKLRGEGGKANHAYFAAHCDRSKQDWQTNRAAAVKMWCPYGAVGDRLWVRETWTADMGNSFSDDDGAWWHEVPKSLRTSEAAKMIYFRADDSRYHNPRIPDVSPEASRSTWEPGQIDLEGQRWQPSIFMPRWASRLTLEITDVRVERVQEISHEDCAAEGIEPGKNLDNTLNSGTVKSVYRNLWDSLNAKRGYGWDVNPWVWVLSFRKVEP